MQPSISVIIPTFNRYSLLGETLESVLSQTFQDWECIVIDDGSIDYTTELLDFYSKRDSRITCFKRPKTRNKGANACRNIGFELSNGAYINWFDDDDIMHPKKLELQYNSLRNSDFNFTVCKTSVFEIFKTNSFELSTEVISSENTFLDYLEMNIKWLTQPPLWKTEFLKQQEYLFDEELQAAQEWEFHCRMLAVSPQYQIVEKPLVFIRKHQSSITYNLNKEFRNWHYFLARLKIYKNNNIHLENEALKFLRTYLINSFKMMIVTNNQFVFKAFLRFIVREPFLKLNTKCDAFLAMLFFKFFNKGNTFLQKIKYL